MRFLQHGHILKIVPVAIGDVLADPKAAFEGLILFRIKYRS